LRPAASVRSEPGSNSHVLIQNSRSAERSCICVVRKTELTSCLADLAANRAFTQFLSCRRTRAFKRRCSISLTRQSRSLDVVAYRAAAHVPLPEITMSNSVPLMTNNSPNSRSFTTSWPEPRSSVGAGYRCGSWASQTQKPPKKRFFSAPCGRAKTGACPHASGDVRGRPMACCDASFKPAKTGLSAAP
jgi:hypothetical protein